MRGFGGSSGHLADVGGEQRGALNLCNAAGVRLLLGRSGLRLLLHQMGADIISAFHKHCEVEVTRGLVLLGLFLVLVRSDGGGLEEFGAAQGLVAVVGVVVAAADVAKFVCRSLGPRFAGELAFVALGEARRVAARRCLVSNYLAGGLGFLRLTAEGPVRGHGVAGWLLADDVREGGGAAPFLKDII